MRSRFFFLLMIFTSSVIYNQSVIVYDAGTIITVDNGADVCANTIIVNGSYNGSGTFCNGLLPVELISFNANVLKDKIELVWQTDTEINNYGFQIEKNSYKLPNIKGETQESWENIGFVAGAGNSNSNKKYSFVDKEVFNGHFAYRLKQIDNDGSFKYSNIVEVNIEQIPSSFSLSQNYPNPFNPNTKIKYSIANRDFVSLKIFDVLGNEVAILVDEMKEPGFYEVEFNIIKMKLVSSLPSGVYFYKLKAGEFNSIKKLVLMK